MAPPKKKRGPPKGKYKGIRIGGRRAGTPNKRTKELVARLEEMGFDPLEALVKICQNPKVPLIDRGHFCVKLLKFVYPERKAIDLAPSEGLKEVLYETQWGRAPGGTAPLQSSRETA